MEHLEFWEPSRNFCGLLELSGNIWRAFCVMICDCWLGSYWDKPNGITLSLQVILLKSKCYIFLTFVIVVFVYPILFSSLEFFFSFDCVRWRGNAPIMAEFQQLEPTPTAASPSTWAWLIYVAFEGRRPFWWSFSLARHLLKSYPENRLASTNPTICKQGNNRMKKSSSVSVNRSKRWISDRSLQSGGVLSPVDFPPVCDYGK